MEERLRKEDARLVMEVLFGDGRLVAVIDGISWDWCGLRVYQGSYVIADWNDVYRKEES